MFSVSTSKTNTAASPKSKRLFNIMSPVLFDSRPDSNGNIAKRDGAETSERTSAKEMKPYRFKPCLGDSMDQGRHVNRVSFQRSYRTTYLGHTILDRRYTLPMLPWIISDIKNQGKTNGRDVYLEVTESSLRAIVSRGEKPIFEHSLQNISKFAQTAQDPCCFTYLIRENPDVPFSCYVFRATDENSVLELFTTMREATKEMAQHHGTSPLTRISSGTSLDTILTNSQQYEVMYVGRIKLPQKRAPPTFIDDAVEKFKTHDLEKVRNVHQQDSKNRHRHGSGASVSSLPYNLDLVEAAKENELASQVNRASKGSFGSGNRDLSSSSEHSSLDNIAEHSGSESKDGSSEFSIFESLKQRSCSPSPTISQGTLQQSASSSSLSPSSSSSQFSQSLITYTQSMDAASKDGILQDLKDCSVSNSTLKPPGVSPSFSLIPNTQSLDATGKAIVMQDLQQCLGPTQRVRSVSGDVPRAKQSSLPLYRARVGSGGAADMKRPRAETASSVNPKNNNRTMLFLIGRLELCLISTDRKQVLLNKTFNYVSHCSQGVKHPDHFGFICRETSFNASEVYVGYVFRCQTEKVVEEIMHALKQAFHTAHQAYQSQVQQQQQSSKTHITVCETCPMQWFHRLCCDVEGVSAEKAQAIILQRLDFLTDAEQDEVMTKYQGSDVNNIQEQNEVFMMLIRTICERKQSKHFHSSNATKNEHHGFLDRKMSSSKLDHLKQKAKKSLSSSFETILKRKSKEEQLRERAVTLETDGTTRITHHEDVEDKPPEVQQTSHTMDFPDGRLMYDKENLSPVSSQSRPRSSTISTTRDVHRETKQRAQTDPELVQPKSPIMNIFMKVGNQNKQSPCDKEASKSSSEKGSWRRNIFHKVQTPVPCEEEALVAEKNTEKFLLEIQPPKRPTAELRELWKKAIMEQIILIRMEKENKKLQANQSAASYKRMKLDYEEITPCLKDAALHWEELLNEPEESTLVVGFAILQEAVKAGIPRHKRGDIWQFLAKQHSLRENPRETCSNIDLTIPYEDLLKQLTSHQHTILVDLGRTFPRHPYFSQPLGAGQLSLFNLLKGYSLLDKEVGYCQGLSFVAGILLLHMPEDQAFALMKHMLFHLGLRGQYKPDMMALQHQLYCLTRLLHDHYHDLYEHFEKHDIPPTLYAAPWFLTLFASQFPLGFVARLFDLIFLEGLETMYKVALALLANHKEALLQCSSFESIMEFLKTSMPSMNIIQMERIFSQVFMMDIRKQLLTYEVEYHVLQEEMLMGPPRVPGPPPAVANTDNTATIQKLENENKTLQHQKQVLEEQLQSANTSIHGLEESVAGHQSTVTRLEARLRSIEDERDALLHSVQVLRRRLELLEQQSGNGSSGNNGSTLKDMSRSRTPSLNVVRALGAEIQAGDSESLAEASAESEELAAEGEDRSTATCEADAEVDDGAGGRQRSGSTDSCSSTHSLSLGGSL